MLGKCLLSVLAVFLFCGAGKDIYLKNITVAELQKIYRQENYKDYIYMPDWRYPRIFLENLPKDMAQMPTLAERNKIFLMILGPLALRLEAEIQKEREEILKLDDDFRQKKDLTPQQVKTLEEKAEKYEVFSGLKGQRRYRLLLDELLLRVDGVPPSILMAAAAINTDWGTSRPAREANNLYKDI
jgi:Bax protein